MESDTLFQQRPSVRKVYKRKKARRQRFPQKLAPSPLRNGITISQESSEEEEEDSVVTPYGSPKRLSSPRKSAQLTPLSSPSRKQKSSPSKSSPRSPSKISIDREIGSIFSPSSSKKTGVPIEEQDDTGKPAWVSPSPSPKKPSFADRMAPRKVKKDDRASAVVDEMEEEGVVSGLNDMSQHTQSNLDSLQDEEEPLPAIEPAKFKPHSRVYRRVPSLPEVDLPSASLMMEDIGEPKPCLSEMNKRWAELDDLDETDDETTAVNSVTGLRSLGQSRRFQEDFQYLVLDLRSSQSLADRRSTLVEIAKKVLTWEEGSEERDYVEEAGAEVDQASTSLRASSITPFLNQIKIADLTNQFWSQLRGAGAGQGEDEIMDLALLLVCLKVAQCDVDLCLSFCGQDDFNSSMVLLIGSSSAARDGQSKDVKRHLSTLNQLARSSLTVQKEEEQITIPRLALQNVWLLVESLGQSAARPTIDIARIQGNCSIADQMWRWVATEAAIVRTCPSYSQEKAGERAGLGYPDGLSVSLIAQVFVSCIDQTNNNLATSAMDLSILLQYFTQIYFISGNSDDQQDTLFETLCSLLRLMVALMAKANSNWTAEFLQVETIDVVIQLMTVSVSDLLGTNSEQNQSRRTDLLTLTLALMTDFLVKDPVAVGQMLVEYKDKRSGPNPITSLALLLQQEKERSESDPNAGYLAGSLAVILALLIIGNESSNHNQNKIAQKDQISDQLKQGIHFSTYQACLTVILSSVDEFAAMVQVASKQYNTLLGKTTRHESETNEDEEFFSHLSTSLMELLESSLSDLSSS